MKKTVMCIAFLLAFLGLLGVVGAIESGAPIKTFVLALPLLAAMWGLVNAINKKEG